MAVNSLVGLPGQTAQTNLGDLFKQVAALGQKLQNKRPDAEAQADPLGLTTEPPAVESYSLLGGNTITPTSQSAASMPSGTLGLGSLPGLSGLSGLDSSMPVMDASTQSLMGKLNNIGGQAVQAYRAGMKIAASAPRIDSNSFSGAAGSAPTIGNNGTTPAAGYTPGASFTPGSGSGGSGVISMARGMKGMDENTHRAELKEFLGGFDPKKLPWCAQFVSKLFEKNGGSPWGIQAGVAGIRNWGQKNGKYQSAAQAATGNIKPGDVFIMPNDKHTGIVTGVEKDARGIIVAVRTLEGNTNAVGSANGNTVAERTRPISQIAGFVST